MKTSNKILLAALGAFLLFTAVDTARFVRHSRAAQPELRKTVAQLERTPIHTLVVEGENRISLLRNRKDRQSFGLDAPFTSETARISHDTLYLKGSHMNGYAELPFAQSFLLNGRPQPIAE